MNTTQSSGSPLAWIGTLLYFSITAVLGDVAITRDQIAEVNIACINKFLFCAPTALSTKSL